MASISVRKLDDKVLKELKLQAVDHGVSMEEEVRHILIEGIKAREGLGDTVLKMFNNVSDGTPIEIPERVIYEPIKL